MSILIYILFLGSYFAINYRKYGLNAASFLLGVYFLGSISGFIIVMNYDYFEIERIKWYAILYHCVCLFLFLSPVVDFSNRYSHNFTIYMPNSTGLKMFTYILIVFGLSAFFVNIPKLSQLLSVDDLSSARSSYNYGTLYEDQNTGIMAYLAGIGSSLAYFSLFLFFYFLSHFPKKKLLIVLLLISSFADPLTSLSIVGRGGIVRWLLVFIFLFLFFKSKLPYGMKQKIMRYGLIISVPFILIFSIITLSRFSDREYSVLFSILNYAGQSFVYFSYNFDQFFDSTFGGRMNFPIFFPNEQISSQLNDMVYTDYYLNTFSTFVGSFYKDMGFYITLLIAVLYKLWSFFYFKMTKYPYVFPRIIVFLILAQIFLNGIFYFMYTGTTAVRTFLLVYILATITFFAFPSKKSDISKVK